ncbi:MAG: acyl carrier protein [Bacteroidaceae bacterium]|nr:acyl carrier protein [Bacteroidaceae bacterium]
MPTPDIYSRLTAVFRDVFDDDALTLTPATSAADIDEWDSLSHVQLIVAVEQEFGLRFTSREILRWQNVGEMAEAIAAKLNA